MDNKQLSEHFYGVDAPKRCPRCQAVWPTNAKFCGYDGEKLICNSTEKTNKPSNADGSIPGDEETFNNGQGW